MENNQAHVTEAGVLTSILKSLVNQYWKFTLFPLAAVTIGMALASIEHGWSWRGLVLSLAMFWVFDQGMKSVDLSADDINLDVDSRIQFTVGMAMITSGFGIGIVLAWLSTWWYLVLLGLFVVFGLAYVLEWFGGRLHDRKYYTGWGNLGFCLGWIPTVAGYVFLAETVSPGILIFAVGPLLCCGTMAWVTEDMKDAVYQTTGIVHDRETPTDVSRLKRRELASQFFRLVGFVFIAVGMLVEFGVTGSAAT